MIDMFAAQSTHHILFHLFLLFPRPGLLAPTLVQFEQEIDQELEKEQQLKHSAGQDNNNPLAVAEPVVVVVARQQQPEQQQAQEEEAATEQAQITNNDLESLHEKVSSFDYHLIALCP